MPGVGHEVSFRVLGVDAALDSRAMQPNMLLGDAERLAGCDANLLAHEVDAAHHFRHRMLDLDAGIHLHERAAAVLVHEELERACAAVADGKRPANRGRSELVALLG